MTRWIAIICVCGMVGILGPSAARGCSVPVFRYALERWPSDAYELTVFHQGAIAGPAKAIVDALQKAADSPEALLNLKVTLVDVSGKMDAEAEAFWKAQKQSTLPWLVLRYPDAPPDAPNAWAGPADSDALAGLLDSPVRRQVADRLMKGDSVVWVLLESGDAARDKAAGEMLEKELRRLEKELELPKVDADDPDVPGPALRSKLPLRLAFPVVKVSSKDPAEAALVNMLTGTAPEPLRGQLPAVVPVFGRGRALPPVAGSELNADTIEEAARFLTGECSCQVKEMNPGIDLLMAADWEALLEEDQAPRAPVLPVFAASPKVAGSSGGAVTYSFSISTDRLPLRLIALAWAGVAGVIAAATLMVISLKRRGRP